MAHNREVGLAENSDERGGWVVKVKVMLESGW
jgi:hypothetical protein